MGRLCNDCVIFRHAMTLYGKEQVIKSVNRIFKRNTDGIDRVQGRLLNEAAKDAATEASN